jgi:thioredoxin reductase (NADPH)
MDEMKVSAKSNGSGKSEHVKMLVIGSGPAGFAAGLYAGRAQLNPVILTGQELGGQVSITHMVENYPGFPEGVAGPELTQLFQKQAESFGAKVVFDTASAVDFSKRPYRVTTYSGEYLADTIVISTGASPRKLDIPGEIKYTGKGVSYCGTCDGFFFKDKEVIVVGGGDSAMEEGSFLTRFANKVTVIHRRDELRASAILEQRAKNNEKIDFIWDTAVESIESKGDGTVDFVKLKNLKSGELSEFSTDGVFIFIGHLPNTAMFADQLEMDDAGYLVVNSHMETNVPGVYAAGEVADPHFRQVITSAGMGAAAAIQATRHLEELEEA